LCFSEVKDPINNLYTDIFIDKLQLYIDNQYISDGVCIQEPSNPFYYKIKFFKNDIIIPFNLISSHKFSLKKNKSSVLWGSFYYDIPSHFDYDLFFNSRNDKKEFMCCNLYGESLIIKFLDNKVELFYTDKNLII
jgi:hypothetical protein